MAAALRNEQDVHVEIVDGERGELTVLMDGHEIAKKSELAMPTVEDVVAKVQKAELAGAHA